MRVVGSRQLAHARLKEARLIRKSGIELQGLDVAKLPLVIGANIAIAISFVVERSMEESIGTGEYRTHREQRALARCSSAAR